MSERQKEIDKKREMREERERHCDRDRKRERDIVTHWKRDQEILGET